MPHHAGLVSHQALLVGDHSRVELARAERPGARRTCTAAHGGRYRLVTAPGLKAAWSWTDARPGWGTIPVAGGLSVRRRCRDEGTRVAALLALVAACSWGGSDFLGGLAGRRAGRDISLPSALIGSGIGLVGLTIVAAAVGGASMSGRDVTFAVGAGIGSAVGVSLLYRGLTIGAMGIVAPITGIGAVALPVLVGTRGSHAGRCFVRCECRTSVAGR